MCQALKHSVAPFPVSRQHSHSERLQRIQAGLHWKGVLRKGLRYSNHFGIMSHNKHSTIAIVCVSMCAGTLSQGQWLNVVLIFLPLYTICDMGMNRND